MPLARTLRFAATAAVVVAIAAIGCATDSTSAGDRTLLLHPPLGAEMAALVTGKLGSDSHGCVTIGNLVLVVGEGSTLHSDGSITVQGRFHRVGETMELGGGMQAAPPNSPCGDGAQYWWL